MTTLIVHGSCVASGNQAVLLRGAPGIGKSDLSLRLIDSLGLGVSQQNHRFKLVSDDQVVLTRIGDSVYASAPETIAGKLEIRGIGLVELVYRKKAKLVLVVDLTSANEIDRMPPEADFVIHILGIAVKHIKIDPISASAAARVRAALS